MPATTIPYQPPLRWWSHLWRLGVVVGVSAMAWLPYGEAQWEHARTLFWTDLALGLISLPLVQLRRRWPYAIALLLTLFASVSASSGGAGLLATVSLATQRRWWQILTIGPLLIVVATLYPYLVPGYQDPLWVTVTTNVAFTIATMAVGMYIGSRRELMWTLRERAIRAEEEQELRVAQARTNERATIAREMHDVLAHRISLLTMHAGALAYRTDLPRDEVARSAEIIQTNAHEALTELRNVLGVLRGQDGGQAKNRPQPTVGDVPKLIAESQGFGMHIEFESTLADGPPVSEHIGRTVYRIVQEALTNARKHAPYAKVAVRVDRDDDGVTIEVRNPLRVGDHTAPGSGLGLVGLAERTELSGGTLEHAINGHGEFELHAWLPCPA